MGVNFPPGTAVKSTIDVATVDFVALLTELKNKAFNGYACISVMGTGGIEEGTLVFDNGKIVACVYEYFKYNKSIHGEEAFPRAMNASAASKGVIDIYQLSNQQVQLFLAFNENAIFVPAEKDLKSFKVGKFSPFYEEQIKEQEKKTTKRDVIKKLKLEDLKREEERMTEDLATQTSENEEDLLSQMTKTKTKKKKK
ncbi:MAG: DUF2226 domain-containing protein [Candidatus Micrarchaeia archaeon]